MSAPQHNTDRLDQVEKLLAEIAKRQENTERLARTTLHAIGETGQLIAATGKLVADNANQLAEAIKMTTDNTERMDRAEQLISNCGKTLAETLEMTGDNAERMDRAEQLIAAGAERMTEIKQHLADAARNMAFMQAQMRGHTAQPVPPAHPAPDQE